MQSVCDDDAHEWEVLRWRCGLGQRAQHPVLRCTQCGTLRPATDHERSWMVRDIEHLAGAVNPARWAARAGGVQ